eukprot:CAMPEP_0119523370 /NCGR_PEP_ID=MMETSP1344-20130328/38448_1 /TAXON_ID=236787 /ORGANISM="Florenciella parvula, Strain CCMP2471" /LENGTH=432 /DNA_ID=CAMNT_0007561575 /DNA_START=67 /DNA_END=1362 /DNA_ORIENTATION=-
MKPVALTLAFAVVTTGIAPHALSAHATAHAAHGMAITVDSGYIVNTDGSVGDFVGTYTSGLQQLIDDSYPTITTSDFSSISIFNATELRYLTLKGDASTDGHSYLSDVTLQLPSMFVLTLEGSMGVAPNATLKSDVTPPMVALDGVSYSAVLGGTYDATGNTTYEAIRIKDGSHCKVEGVTGYGSGTNIIEVHNGNRHEISHSTLDGGDAAFRCIWLLATNHGLVHFNYATRCVGHVIDFDAYTSNSAAWSNVAEYNNPTGVGEGIFVEETATNNFIFNNTASNNGGNGIALYSSVVGPVTGNIIAANTAENNAGHGLSSGGYGHDPVKHAGDNIFVGNTASGNSGNDLQIMHGAAINDYWTGNDGGYTYDEDPHSSANVTVFEPEQLAQAAERARAWARAEPPLAEAWGGGRFRSEENVLLRRSSRASRRG